MLRQQFFAVVETVDRKVLQGGRSTVTVGFLARVGVLWHRPVLGAGFGLVEGLDGQRGGLLICHSS